MLGRQAIGLVGVSANPIGSAKPAWTRLLADYGASFPKVPFTGFAAFYFDAMEPALRALEAVDGDLSDGGKRFRVALAGLELDLPTGHVRLDAHRQAVAPNYLLRVGAGRPELRTIRTVGPVDDSYGGRFGPGKPLPSRTSPPCTRGNPPPWAG